MTRDGYNACIERHEVAWELSMGSLALFWVALGFLVDQVGPGVAPRLAELEIVVTAVFVAEFTSRIPQSIR